MGIRFLTIELKESKNIFNIILVKFFDIKKD